eukprot:scaffold146849_cov23-Tisochrysis_lutea.AAC.2
MTVTRLGPLVSRILPDWPRISTPTPPGKRVGGGGGAAGGSGGVGGGVGGGDGGGKGGESCEKVRIASASMAREVGEAECGGRSAAGGPRFVGRTGELRARRLS